MSAAELLRHVKSLPAPEREKLLAAILMLEEKAPVSRPVGAKRVRWPDVEARARRIFGNHVLPNLVLLEREEQSF